MGNLRFRLSDMMPNAWFYKLKDMGTAGTGARTTSHKRGGSNNTKKSQRNQPASPPPSKPPKQPHHQQYSYSRKSYYFTRDLNSKTNAALPDSPSKLSDHPSSPRKSSKQRAARRRAAGGVGRPSSTSSPKKLVSSSVSGGCGCRANWNKTDFSAAAVVVAAGDRSVSLSDSDSDSFPPEFRSDCSLTTESFDKMVSWSSNSCGCPDSGSNDIIIDIDKRSLADPVAHQVLDGLPDRDLPPIFTKPSTSSFDDRIEDIKRKDETGAAKKQGRPCPPKKQQAQHFSKPRASSLSVKVGRDESLTARQHGRKLLNSANSPGIKLRVNSPRIGYRRNMSRVSSTTTTNSTSSSSRSSVSKKSGNLSGCLAVVKSSCDPQTDFRDSMVEMIVENNLSASKDLEDLLACYLSLNADEYHDVIIKVFKQIWFDYLLTSSRSK